MNASKPTPEEIVERFDGQEDVYVKSVRDEFNLTKHELEQILGNNPSKRLMMMGLDMGYVHTDDEVIDHCIELIEEYEGHLSREDLEELIPISVNNFLVRVDMDMEDVREEYNNRTQRIKQNFEDMIEDGYVTMEDVHGAGMSHKEIMDIYGAETWGDLVKDFGYQPVGVERSVDDILYEYVDIASEKSRRPKTNEFLYSRKIQSEFDSALDIPMYLGLPDYQNSTFKIAVEGPKWSHEIQDRGGVDSAMIRGEKINWIEEIHTKEEIATRIVERYPDIEIRNLPKPLRKPVNFVRKS